MNYARGSVLEWYVNDNRGLEQGFTLSAPPEDTAAGPSGATARVDDGAVLLVVEISGTLQPVLAPNGRAIDLVGAAYSLTVAHRHRPRHAGRLASV